MNQLGAVAESATTMDVMGTEMEPARSYRLDGPFIAVITRPGIGIRTPIFAGYIALDSFADPG
ncbi:MAG TPA: hypothetical protein VHR45_05750 [Thermoanaerobaculia bacterium]|nr:hypothetical protein [Thermoanaerobaculia bacterium]